MDLLPCPFCGDDEPEIRGADGKYSVVCPGCGRTSIYHYRLDAIAAWNRRAPADPALLALAELRDATDEEVADLEEEVREASARVAELKTEYALARFGAYVVRDWFRRGSGFQAADGFLLDEGALGTGVVMRGATVGYRHAPGIASAIAALLAPDGAASEGEVAP